MSDGWSARRVQLNDVRDVRDVWEEFWSSRRFLGWE